MTDIDERANAARLAFSTSPAIDGDSLSWDEIPPAGKDAWRSVVRAVDATAPPMIRFGQFVKGHVQRLSNGAWEWCHDGGFDHGVIPLAPDVCAFLSSVAGPPRLVLTEERAGALVRTMLNRAVRHEPGQYVIEHGPLVDTLLRISRDDFGEASREQPKGNRAASITLRPEDLPGFVASLDAFVVDLEQRIVALEMNEDQRRETVRHVVENAGSVAALVDMDPTTGKRPEAASWTVDEEGQLERRYGPDNIAGYILPHIPNNPSWFAYDINNTSPVATGTCATVDECKRQCDEALRAAGWTLAEEHPPAAQNTTSVPGITTRPSSTPLDDERLRNTHHREIATIKDPDRHLEACRRASVSFSAEDSAIALGAKVDGDWMVWPDGERYPRRLGR